MLALASTTLSANSVGGPAVIDNAGTGTAGGGGVTGQLTDRATGTASGPLGALDWISASATSGDSTGLTKPTNPSPAGALIPISSPAIVASDATGAVNQSLVTASASPAPASAPSSTRLVARRLASIDHALEHDLLKSLDWARDEDSQHGSGTSVLVRLDDSGSSSSFSSAIQYGKFRGRRAFQAESATARGHGLPIELSLSSTSSAATGGHSNAGAGSEAGAAPRALVETRRPVRPT